MRTLIIPVSGGKDSEVVLSVALERMRGVCPIRVVHQNTKYDHPHTYRTIEAMSRFYDVPIEHTEPLYGGMFGFLDAVGYFPNSGARGCTQRLKQEPFAAWLQANNLNNDNCEIWFGMRSDESAARAQKYGDFSSNDLYELRDISPFYGGTKHKLATIGRIPVRLPIVHMTTADVFRYLELEGAPLNPLYAQGHKRVGCYPCLLAQKSEWVNAGKDPVGREHIAQLIQREDRWKAEGNPRKFIKVHRVWDVREFLKGGGENVRELTNEECGYCSI